MKTENRRTSEHSLPIFLWNSRQHLKEFIELLLVYISDIDECTEGYSGDDKCEHNCTNTVGSFICSCSNGYELNSNNFSCDGKNIALTLLEDIAYALRSSRPWSFWTYHGLDCSLFIQQSVTRTNEWYPPMDKFFFRLFSGLTVKFG